jgi:hypothetical protein
MKDREKWLNKLALFGFLILLHIFALQSNFYFSHCQCTEQILLGVKAIARSAEYIDNGFFRLI